MDHCGQILMPASTMYCVTGGLLFCKALILVSGVESSLVPLDLYLLVLCQADSWVEDKWLAASAERVVPGVTGFLCCNNLERCSVCYARCKQMLLCCEWSGVTIRAVREAKPCHWLYRHDLAVWRISIFKWKNAYGQQEVCCCLCTNDVAIVEYKVPEESSSSKLREMSK